MQVQDARGDVAPTRAFALPTGHRLRDCTGDVESSCAAGFNDQASEGSDGGAEASTTLDERRSRGRQRRAPRGRVDGHPRREPRDRRGVRERPTCRSRAGPPSHPSECCRRPEDGADGRPGAPLQEGGQGRASPGGPTWRGGPPPSPFRRDEAGSSHAARSPPPRVGSARGPARRPTSTKTSAALARLCIGLASPHSPGGTNPCRVIPSRPTSACAWSRP